MKQKQEETPSKPEQEINDVINAGDFFINVYKEFQKSAAIITFQSISPILNELNQIVDQISQVIIGEYDLDSTYMLPFMVYLNKINKFVETIERIAIKNGIEKSFFKDDWRFSNRIESIKNDLLINHFENDKIESIDDTISKLNDIEKKINDKLNKLKEYLENVEDKWPIIEIINALYLNEPENQYADDELLFYDCSLKLSLLIENKSEVIKDWRSMKEALLKIFNSNFYNVLSITSKENMKLKHHNPWEIKVIETSKSDSQ